MSDIRFKFDLSDAPHYPFIRMTSSDFPQFFASRTPGKGSGKFFGPFLDRTAARMLIDFISTTFKPRGCVISIDGNFNVPCVQYYHKRCLAPCVRYLCSPEEYTWMAGLAELFLKNERVELIDAITGRIDVAASDLDFESAASFRDMITRIEAFWSEKKLNVWLDDTVDTIDLETDNDTTTIHLVTQRGRRLLGSRTYSWGFIDVDIPTRALSEFLIQFYKWHVPREIRISHDIPERKNVVERLDNIGKGKTKIKTVGKGAKQVTTLRHLTRTRNEDSISRLAVSVTPEKVANEMRSIFGLAKPPRLIAAFDSAHISGTTPTAARTVWIDGVIDPTRSTFAIAEQARDIRVLADFVWNSLSADRERTDLVLIDGGLAYLQAVKESLREMPERPAIIAAVKPPDDHNAISYFLTETGERIDNSSSIASMRLLTVLRNEAHSLANFVHAEARDMAHFYELANALPSLTEPQRAMLRRKFTTVDRISEQSESEIAVVIGKVAARVAIDELKNQKRRISPIHPLIVPIFYIDPNGDAEDLRPIKTRI